MENIDQDRPEVRDDFDYLGGRSGLGASESDVRSGMEVAPWDPWVNHRVRNSKAISWAL